MEYAVSRGAVGVSVEYRLATEGRTVHHCIGDCAAAVRYLRENAAALGILPDKICVCGESAGGHLALCLGTPAIVADPMARPNYIVNFNGAVDLTGRLNRELFGPCDMQTVQPDEWLEKYRAGGRGLAASAGRAGQRARDPYARPERRNHLPLRNRPAP